jgi:hypothetical protein
MNLPFLVVPYSLSLELWYTFVFRLTHTRPLDLASAISLEVGAAALGAAAFAGVPDAAAGAAGVAVFAGAGVVVVAVFAGVVGAGVATFVGVAAGVAVLAGVVVFDFVVVVAVVVVVEEGVVVLAFVFVVLLFVVVVGVVVLAVGVVSALATTRLTARAEAKASIWRFFISVLNFPFRCPCCSKPSMNCGSFGLLVPFGSVSVPFNVCQAIQRYFLTASGTTQMVLIQ